MNVSCRLIKTFDEYIVDKKFKTNYQLIVKSLMYIMLKTRFDIIYFILVTVDTFSISLKFINKRSSVSFVICEKRVASSDTEAGLRQDHVM
jgi:hypothetical protein